MAGVLPAELNQPRLVTASRAPRLKATLHVNILRSTDFMADVPYDTRRFRTLNVLDKGMHEVLSIDIDTSLHTQRAIRALEQLKEWCGLPQAIRCDNRPEYTPHVFVD
jgi:putative transposase